MNDSTGTTRTAPRAAVNKVRVLAGFVLAGFAIMDFIPPVNVAVVVVGAAMAVAGGVIVIDAVLGHPLGRFQGFHIGMTCKSPRGAVDRWGVTCGVCIFNFGIQGALSPSNRGGVVAVGAVNAAVGGAMVVKAVIGNPFQGVHPFRSRGLPGTAPWRAGGRGAAPVAGAGVVARAGWRVMRISAWLMPPAAGRRWLAEAWSFLDETPSGLRRRAVGSYLAGAPKVITMCWAVALARLARLVRRGPPPR